MRIRDLVLGAALAGLVLAMGVAGHAHPGGLAKDGCHNDKAAGEAHWHEPGTRDRAGPCIESAGSRIKVIVQTDPATAAALQDVEARVHSYADKLRDAGNTIDALRDDVRDLRRAERRARADAAAANAERELAADKLRDVMSGAPVCALERAAVQTELGCTFCGDLRRAANKLLVCLSAGEL